MSDHHGNIVDRDPHNVTIRFERRVEAGIDETWRWLTEPDRLVRWLAPTMIDLRVGGAVEHRFDETDDGLARGRIRRLEGPHLLEYEWLFSGEPDSVVCFELRADGEATVITLTHRMLGVGHAAGYGAGWHAHLDQLGAALLGESLSWDDRFGELIGDYQTRFTSPSPAITSTGVPEVGGVPPRGATTTGQTAP
jgi:uncharacterized protein YndB with AHSA1/START domain